MRRLQVSITNIQRLWFCSTSFTSTMAMPSLTLKWQKQMD